MSVTTFRTNGSSSPCSSIWHARFPASSFDVVTLTESSCWSKPPNICRIGQIRKRVNSEWVFLDRSSVGFVDDETERLLETSCWVHWHHWWITPIIFLYSCQQHETFTTHIIIKFKWSTMAHPSLYTTPVVGLGAPSRDNRKQILKCMFTLSFSGLHLRWTPFACAELPAQH